MGGQQSERRGNDKWQAQCELQKNQPQNLPPPVHAPCASAPPTCAPPPPAAAPPARLSQPPAPPPPPHPRPHPRRRRPCLHLQFRHRRPPLALLGPCCCAAAPPAPAAAPPRGPEPAAAGAAGRRARRCWRRCSRGASVRPAPAPPPGACPAGHLQQQEDEALFGVLMGHSREPGGSRLPACLRLLAAASKVPNAPPIAPPTHLRRAPRPAVPRGPEHTQPPPASTGCRRRARGSRPPAA